MNAAMDPRLPSTLRTRVDSAMGMVYAPVLDVCENAHLTSPIPGMACPGFCVLNSSPFPLTAGPLAQLCAPYVPSAYTLLPVASSADLSRRLAQTVVLQ